MKATALVEYTASSPQEISLQQGAIVHVLSKVALLECSLGPSRVRLTSAPRCVACVRA